MWLILIKVRILAQQHHCKTWFDQFSSMNLVKEPGFMSSPLNEPVPDLDRSAPECPTLWYCGADTSALKREKTKNRKRGTDRRPAKGKPTRDGLRQKQANRSEQRARGRKQNEGNWKKWMRKWTGITWRVTDSLREKKRGRKKSGTAESNGLSEDEMPSLLSLQWGSSLRGVGSTLEDTKANTAYWKILTQIKAKVPLSVI